MDNAELLTVSGETLTIEYDGVDDFMKQLILRPGSDTCSVQIIIGKRVFQIPASLTRREKWKERVNLSGLLQTGEAISATIIHSSLTIDPDKDIQEEAERIADCISAGVKFADETTDERVYDRIREFLLLGEVDKILDLSNCSIVSLPDSFGQLAALKGLSLDNNQLTALPDSFGQLAALEWLYLDNNQLTALPDSFSQLVALEWLSLDNNQLAALPESFSQLAALKELSLHNNPELGNNMAKEYHGQENIKEALEKYFKNRAPNSFLSDSRVEAGQTNVVR